MPVYVDRARNGYGRMLMCHMIADSFDELHAMTEALGLRRVWFQAAPPASFPHYDVSQSKRADAIKLGAIDDLPRKEQVAIIEAAKVSGYRDRPVARVMQQRGHLAKPASTRSTAHLPVIATPTAHEIQRLAAFIDETYKNPPADIRRIISKYTATVRTTDKEKPAAARA